MRRRTVALVLAGLAMALVSGIAVHQWRSSPEPTPPSSPGQPAQPTFVGALTCGGCHTREYQGWLGSHHQLAMQPATSQTVLGDFGNAVFTNAGVTSTFFKRADRFMVGTDGLDGALHDYPIDFTFGVSPLQQYLIAMPGGRLQALGIAWDSRARTAGGQRWFFLYPGQEITASDRLHWTAIDQTWNYMCADCHSTNLRKNYDSRTRTYATSYAEIGVACEACHGPGSGHLEWAKEPDDRKSLEANEGLTIALGEHKDSSWTIDPRTGNPFRTTPRTSDREIEVCARCHSRRGEIHEDYVYGQPASDDYRIALLSQDLYFPDGQIKGEVYEYGSFLQSRMYREGVTCSDCHEPHSLALRADGNAVCLQCHSSKYDSPSHHFHPKGSCGAQCVNCHMPSRTYMVIDARRDHSIRVPRPDLSINLGTPNACNQCHKDKSPQWASAAIIRWYGTRTYGLQHFAETLHDGAEGAPGADRELEALAANHGQPPIARATALSLLARAAAVPAATISLGAEDDSSLVRRATAQVLPNSDAHQVTSIIQLLLNDPVRAVRIETAEVLAAPPGQVPAEISEALNRATGEYIAAQELNADRPEAHLNLALLFAREAQMGRAESELKTALSLDPAFAPAAVNLADLYREQGRDSAGEEVLRSELQRSPGDASIFYALGLLKIRQKQSTAALGLLAEAARLEPGNPRYQYVYALALNENGNSAAAIRVLRANLQANPYDGDSLSALADFERQAVTH